MREQCTRVIDCDDARYHSIFASLKELGICDSTNGAADIYGPSFASFYNEFVGREMTDIPIYERMLSDRGGRVLDLACGCGRIGIVLARFGATVDGIDLSPAMLALVAKNLEMEDPDVAGRLNVMQGDITSFDLPYRYDLILLGATSISLLLAPWQRMAVFTRVRKHLKPGGRFAFDILALGGDRWRALDGLLEVWSCESGEGQEFAIVGNRFCSEDSTFTFNVYREVIGWDGATSRYLGSSTKAWLKEEEVKDALAQAGMQLIETFEHGGALFFISSRAITDDDHGSDQ
jgi:SAM-dependent methyltransferase